ncbi:MAG: 4Fe-4S binding protein [Candidatus Methanospirareceae archaeon]
MPATVDLEKCNGCKGRKEPGTSACVEECPMECIYLVEDDPSTAPHGRAQHAVVHADECSECETCVDVCEQGAISMGEIGAVEAQTEEAANRLIVQIVRYKSGLSDEQVLEQYQARSSQNLAVKGLIQKYYLSFPTTGEHGAIYLWESEEALQEFRESELARSIPDVLQIQGTSDVETAEVVMVLRPDMMVPK